jgi:large subunit ribosomal protein L11
MKKGKKPEAIIKLNIEAQNANPAPPIGPALGQKKVDIMKFCKEFNTRTQGIEKGTPLPVIIEVYKDKSFEIFIKKPTVSYYLQKACGLTKGSSEAGRAAPIAEITEEQCIIIAKEKMSEMNTDNLEAAVKTVKGSARSMGLKVISETNKG